MRRSIAVLMLLFAGAHRGPPPEPWDQWAKPGRTEEQRAGDFPRTARVKGRRGVWAGA